MTHFFILQADVKQEVSVSPRPRQGDTEGEEPAGG